MTGNYHEFHFGPVRDSEEIFSLPSARLSSGAGVRFESEAVLGVTFKECIPPSPIVDGYAW